MSLSPLEYLELFAVVTSLGFIILMIYQNIWCWPIGIISSLSSIYLFFSTKLYAESFLYFYYVLIGIYGWYIWNKHKGERSPVVTRNGIYHVLVISVGIVLSAIVGFLFYNYTDAKRPFADSSSTVFSLVASYMEAHKVLSSWFFWIVINLFSIWLYYDRGLKYYSGLMVFYFLLSVAGYIQWKKSYKKKADLAKSPL